MLIKNLALVLLIASSPLLSFAQSFEEVCFKYDVDEISYVTVMEHADLNGDGLDDFIMITINNGPLMLAINRGLNRPQIKVISSLLDIHSVGLIDIDADGDMDLIVEKGAWSDLYLLVNDGNANFEHVSIGVDYYGALHFADVTGDGYMEIIIGAWTSTSQVPSGQLTIYAVDPASFELTEIFSETYFDGFNNEIAAITSTDYDKDGDLDIILSHKREGLLLLEQTNQLSFEDTLIYDASMSGIDLDVAKFNNDGIPDFLLYNDNENDATLVVSQPDGSYIHEVSDLGIGSTNLMTSGNIFGDDIDEVLVSQIGNALAILTYKDGIKVKVNLGDHPEVFSGGITDIDNDGDNDIYFYKNEVGEAGLYYYISDRQSATQTLTETQFKIYPNPTIDEINIEAKYDLDYQATLYDLQGRVIKTANQSTSLELAGVKAGNYLLELVDKASGERFLEKVVIGQ